MRRTDYKDLKFRVDSTESYSLNCQFVLALMQIGGGNAESETLLNFMELPHGSTFKRSSFSRVQSAIRPTIKAISDESMLQARKDEIRATHGENKLTQYVEKKLNPKDVPLTVSYSTNISEKNDYVPLVGKCTDRTNDVKDNKDVPLVEKSTCHTNDIPERKVLESYKSIDVDSTQIMKKKLYDSNIDENIEVKFDVQNYFDMEENYKSFSEDDIDCSSECDNNTL